jgi:hypothetical protein
VQIAQEHFEKSWQDNNAELIFSTKPTMKEGFAEAHLRRKDIENL